jgi:hypothetical protein
MTGVMVVLDNEKNELERSVESSEIDACLLRRDREGSEKVGVGLGVRRKVAPIKVGLTFLFCTNPWKLTTFFLLN